MAAAATCTDCGVIESVTPFEKKGEGTGIGAVAGGVIGGVVGNQVGGGNGKKAMTVLGAVGGGMAGHEIEKRSKSTTVHEVRVKMDDGSVRTLEVAEKLMLQVHYDGRAVVSSGTREKAELDVFRLHEHGLWATMQQD